MTHFTKSIAPRNKVENGIMKKNDKTYSFIQSEDGTDTFVIPSACASFGNQLPAVRTKVTFKNVTDANTGKLRADAVTLATIGDPSNITEKGCETATQ